MTLPLFIIAGGSVFISFSILSLMILQGLSCSPNFLNQYSQTSEHIFLIGSIAQCAALTWTISLGEMRPTATFDISRSSRQSDVYYDVSSSLSCLLLMKFSIISSRSSMLCLSFKGRVIHLLSRRPPIGDMVWSMTSRKVDALSLKELNISRFLIVNLSSHT